MNKKTNERNEKKTNQRATKKVDTVKGVVTPSIYQPLVSQRLSKRSS